MTEEWKVGDQIGRGGGLGPPIGPFTITKVSARKLTLNDGSEWTNTRWPACWGRHGRGSLSRWTQDDVDEQDRYKRRADAQKLADVIAERRNDLTWDQIRAIRAALGIKDESK